MLVKVDRKDTQTVVDALIRTARQLPEELYKSLTWDRGKELADHRRFTLATDIQVYFCDPQSSVGRTRTPMDCYGSTSRRASTCRGFPKHTSMRLQEA